jgi:hypothetical protein
MTEPVRRWMIRAGLVVRAEFVTPWGMCDLVGAELKPEQMLRRVALRQVRAIGSLRRLALLLAIPHVKSGRSVTISALARRLGSDEAVDISAQMNRLITDRFVIQTGPGLQRLWMPLHSRLVAIELKLSRVEEAMRQARRNLLFVEESFVALPGPLAVRVFNDVRRWRESFDAGIGLLSVKRKTCDVLLPAKRTTQHLDHLVRLYSGEKFWTPSVQRQLNIKGSATHSGRRAGPSSSRSGRDLPSAYAAERS